MKRIIHALNIIVLCSFFFLNFEQLSAQGNAGKDDYTCFSYYSMQATALDIGYTGLWKQISGNEITIEDTTAYNTRITGLTAGEYELVWLVTDPIENTTSDTVKITCETVEISVYTTVNMCKQGTYQFEASGGDVYSWYSQEEALALLSGTNISNPVLSAGDYIGTVQYIITVSNDNCSAQQTITVTINDLPSVNGGNPQTIYCLGDGSQLEASSGDNGTYSWSPAKSLSNAYIYNPIANPVKTTTYTVTLTDNNGCSATAEATVTVDIPNLTADITDVTEYQGNDGAIDLTVTGGKSPYTYDWSNGATWEDISKLYTGEYTVEVYSNNDECITSGTYTVSEPQPCDYTVDFDFDTEELKIENLSEGDGLSYYWEFGDGSYSTDFEPNPELETGDYEICLTVTDASGCITTVCKKAQIGDIDCDAEFSYTTDVDNEYLLYFEDNSVGDIDIWYWDFGDGDYSTEESPSHEFAENQSYKICLYVFDKDTRCISRECTEIQVGTLECKADFTYFVDPENRTVSFSDLSTNAAKWYWNFGDVAISKLENPVIQFDEEGIYKTSLVIRSESGCQSAICENIQVGDIPECTAEFEYFIDPVEYSVEFENTSSESLSAFQWDFGDGITSVLENPTHEYINTGKFDVCLTAYSAELSCQSKFCDEIQITTDESDNCSANFTYFIDMETSSVTFSNTSTGNVSNIGWVLGDGSVATDESFTHTYDNSGTYNVYLYTYDSETGCLSRKYEKIKIPEPDSDEITECEADYTYYAKKLNNAVLFYDQSNGEDLEYYWDFGDKTYSTLSSPEHEYEEAGVYEVCLSTVEPSTSCESSSCKNIQVYSLTNVDIVPDFSYYVNSSILVGVFSSLANITNRSNSITNYYWTFGDGTSSDDELAIHQYDSEGVYEVCLRIYDAKSDAQAEICKEVIVGSPGCSVQADYSYLIIPDSLKVKFFDKSIGKADTWFWEFGDGETSFHKNPVHKYSESGTYLVKLSAFNAEGACFANIEKDIQIGTAVCIADFDYNVYTKQDGTARVNFENTSKGDAFYWEFHHDDSNSAEENPSVSYDEAGIYIVSLTVSDESGTCMDKITKRIQVQDSRCSADFYSTYIGETDDGYEIQLTNGLVDYDISYYWVFGDGSTTTGANPTHVFSNAGYFHVSLVTYRTDPDICVDYNSELVTVENQSIDCEADFAYQIDRDTREVKFYNTSAGDNLKHVWNLLDTIYYVENPVHTFEDDGYYNVCLTVINKESLIMNTTCRLIKVSDDYETDCRADFVHEVDADTKVVRFIDKSLEASTRTWDFGDGEESTTTTADAFTHQYSEAGYYMVHLNTENSVGCQSDVYRLLNVGLETVGLKAGFVGIGDDSNKKSGGYPTDFIGASFGEPAKAVWDFGDCDINPDDCTDSTSTTPTHVYTQPGTYTVCMTVSDPVTGEEDVTCQDIVVGTSNVNDNQGFLLSIGNYPNPFKESTTITYVLNQQSNVEIALYDLSGRKIECLLSTEEEAGYHQLEWDDINLNPGIYCLQLKTPDNTITRKIIVAE